MADASSALCCSFCRKSQDSVSKLISSPSDYPRAYICNECIDVCVAILNDDRYPAPAVSETLLNIKGKHPLLGHCFASPLLSAIEQWIRHESLGLESAEELGEVRKIAKEMVADWSETSKNSCPS